MKRNQHLVLLSKDHHFGLLCSWKVQQGLNKNIEPQRIATYINFFWNIYLHEHFIEEEEILFPFSDEQHNTQISSEHLEIKHLIEEISEQKDRTLMNEFATKLHDHIRFEERTWFPFLEEHLSDENLIIIGNELEKVHQTIEDNYEDEFWK